MAMERWPVVAWVPGAVAAEEGLVRLPLPAADPVYDRGLEAGRLVLAERANASLELALEAAQWRAADAEYDAATVARAREVLREQARREVAARPEPSALRLYAGLALLLVLVAAERLWLVARWLWVRARILGWVAARLGRLRLDRLDRGNVSPLTVAVCCVALFFGCVLAFGR
jgi:hypothetical protein